MRSPIYGAFEVHIMNGACFWPWESFILVEAMEGMAYTDGVLHYSNTIDEGRATLISAFMQCTI